jgi:phosphoglycolate phosphatase
MINRIRGVIFDLDGTLLYTLEDIRNSLNHALQVHGFPPLDLERVRALVGRGLRQLAIDAAGSNADPGDAEEIYDELREHYQKDPIGVSRPYDGVMPVLKELHRRGLRLGLWSNKDDSLVQVIGSGLFPGIFNAVRGRIDGSPPKPAADAGLEILRAWGMDGAEVLYVGDSEVDAQSAAACGMPFLAVSWGYRDREDLIAAGARWIIDEPEDILRLI